MCSSYGVALHVLAHSIRRLHQVKCIISNINSRSSSEKHVVEIFQRVLSSREMSASERIESMELFGTVCENYPQTQRQVRIF